MTALVDNLHVLPYTIPHNQCMYESVFATIFIVKIAQLCFNEKVYN